MAWFCFIRLLLAWKLVFPRSHYHRSSTNPGMGPAAGQSNPLGTGERGRLDRIHKLCPSLTETFPAAKSGGLSCLLARSLSNVQ